MHAVQAQKRTAPAGGISPVSAAYNTGMWKKIRPYLISILLALAVGGLGALASHSAMETFESLVQPPLAPPGWLFPVVWTVLYILMGISAAIIYTSPQGDRRGALGIYAAQLAVNLGWTVLFFPFGLYLAALIWLLALILLIVCMILRFCRIDPRAAYLQLPYLVWCLFAAYLNFGIYVLNA